MKPFLFKYKESNNTYFVEAYNESDANEAISKKFNISFTKGTTPSSVELKRLWNKKDDLKPILTIKDIYSEEFIKKAESIYRAKFWISRLYQQDSIDWSNKNNPKYKHVEYCTKTNEGVINRFFTEGKLVPNTGFVVPIDSSTAVSQKLYLHDDFISCVKSVKEFLISEEIEDSPVNQDVTLGDLVDGLLCGY